MGLSLKTNDIIFLDTAVFIYFFEKHEDYYIKLLQIFDQLYETNAQAITSVITYIELTTHPAIKGQTQLVRKYRDYLSNSENMSLFPLDMDIADNVVSIRAKYNFKTPDAIQIGTAAACGADYILTNDKKWLRFKEIPVLLVDEL
jgi:predicted nucleic acid-binding protein